jgi:cytochrome P450
METAQQSQCPVHKLDDEYNPLVPPQLSDPFPMWARARNERPVFYSSALGAWVVTRYADIVNVLRNPGEFGPGVERKMFGETYPEVEEILADLPPLAATKAHSAEPPVHTKLRRYLQPALMPRKVASLEPELRAMSHALVDAFEPRGHGDFYQDYAYRFPLLVVCHLLGLPEEYHDQIREWADQQHQFRHGNPSREAQLVAAKSQRDAFAFNLDLVSRRRANPGNDLLSWIIEDSDNSQDPLSEAQLASQVTSLLTAGHETSSHFLTLLLRRALQDRWLWSGLIADPSVIPAVVEEALRVDGPVQSLWRRAKVDVEVGGVSIPAGARVSLVVGSGNVDEATFESPAEFKPDRSNIGHHIAFGRGIHTCVGAGIARMESRITLKVLSARLPGMRLAADDGILFKPSATQRMAQRLYVEWG